jgi:6-phosphogluconate dehydrogenase
MRKNMSTESQGQRHVGVVGLAVMGENLALNLERNGFAPAVYNRTGAVTEHVLATSGKGTDLLGTYTIEEFVASLARPRRILLMVKAGAAVDTVMQDLTPYLEQGDILIDGGNSFFHDTERRSAEIDKLGFNFVGMGVSGGEEGALWGPSLMPGGPADAYKELAPMLTAIAAISDSGPCVTHIGPGGSGHYVKMIHNGIEYGDMQLIAETYDIMRRSLGMSAPEIADVFARWNEGKLGSFLIEITAEVLQYVDEETNRPLVDVIADEAEQKGTGRWTSQNSYELGIPTPVINAAVNARSLSALKQKRIHASKILHGPGSNGVPAPAAPDHVKLIDALEDALYFAKISSYAQGMALLRAASDDYRWGLNLSEIARIWKAGCIIRAKLLDPIMDAFSREQYLDSMLLDPFFADAINTTQAGIRTVLHTALDFGIPTLALSTALGYVDSYRQEFLPANLIQAQRDFFGAHTYKRLDKDGVFHTEWAAAAASPQLKVVSKEGEREAWAGGTSEGDRSPIPATAPAGTVNRVIQPEKHEELDTESEDRGERTPGTARKAEY